MSQLCHWAGCLPLKRTVSQGFLEEQDRMKMFHYSGLDGNGPHRLINRMKICDKVTLLDRLIQVRLGSPVMPGCMLERL